MRPINPKAILAACAAMAFAAPAAFAQFTPFTPIDTAFSNTGHVLTSTPVQSAILFRGAADTATNKNGLRGPAKDNNDYISFYPINGRADSGIVLVNNEQITRDSLHGDGGGMTAFTATFKNNAWSVVTPAGGKFRSVDFSPVGGTTGNCGGVTTPFGTVLTAEESEQTSNAGLYGGGAFRDTSDIVITTFNGQPINKTIKRYQNVNWMVEVNPSTAAATRKMYHMGRFAHEGGYAMADQKTVYLTDDATPGVLFKFISDTVGNYNRGQLYAYKQSVDGLTGSWITIPMDIDTMLVARTVALRRGATMFTRLEWVVEAGGKLYITETGLDNSANHRNVANTLGVSYNNVAKHLRDRRNADSSITDYYGRILRLDPATGKLDVLLEGGAGATTTNHFSNPDGLTAVTFGSKTYLVVQEDLNGITQGRVSAGAVTANRTICEMYWLDLASATPTVDSLKRMLVGPIGSELTGARFTPDGKTLLVNIQHPSNANPAPYNTSYTLAVWGYVGPTGLLFDAPRFKSGSNKLQVEVNSLSRIAYFDRKVDVELFNIAGKRLERHRGVDRLDISGLVAGNYYFRFNGGEDMHRLLVQ